MTSNNYHRRRIPDYYRNMYMDGYSAPEIIYSLHQKMIREYQERQQGEDIDKVDIHIKSEIKVK